MLKKVVGVFFTVVAILIIDCLFFYNLAAAQENKTTAKEVTVDTGFVHYQQIPEYVPALGTLVAVKSTALSFLSDGHLVQKFFHNGDNVKKNDVVAKIDNGILASQFASAKANLDEAQSNYKRYELLKGSGVFSKQDYISVSTTLKVAKAKYASVLEQEQQLSLSAPFSGTLGKYNFSVGAEIKAGTPVVNLVQLDPLKVNYSMSQKEKGKVKTGQQIFIYSETWPGEKFEGKVVYISPTINPDTGQFDVESLLQNSYDKLSPGGLVQVKHILSQGKKMLVVHQKSIVVDQNRSYVYVIRHAKAHQQNVITGKFTDNGNIIVLSGLKDGAEVVVTGVQKLSEGIPVKVTGHPEIPQKIIRSPSLASKTKPLNNSKIAEHTTGKEVHNEKFSTPEKSPNKQNKQSEKIPDVKDKSEHDALSTIKKEAFSENGDKKNIQKKPTDTKKISLLLDKEKKESVNKQ